MCRIANCVKKVKAHGLCAAHYARLRLHGDPLAGGVPLASRGAPMRWLQAHSSHSGDECLIWPFQRDRDGYARMASKPASRAMLEITVGSEPGPGYVAAHSCANGHLGCVNPKHLRWATTRENVQDRIDHGNNLSGSKHGRARLTDEQVEWVRSMRGKMRQKDIAARFGVAQTTISAIQRGETWR